MLTPSCSRRNSISVDSFYSIKRSCYSNFSKKEEASALAYLLFCVNKLTFLSNRVSYITVQLSIEKRFFRSETLVVALIKKSLGFNIHAAGAVVYSCPPVETHAYPVLVQVVFVFALSSDNFTSIVFNPFFPSIIERSKKY